MTDTEATEQPSDDVPAADTPDTADAPDSPDSPDTADSPDSADDDLVSAAIAHLRRHSARYLVALVGLASFTITALMLTPGHFWGDDWTLYIRQAEGIVHLRTGDVVRDARFTVDESIGPPFSPRVYPWGTAMLLAVPIAALGRHIAALKLTMAFSMAVASMTLFAVARRRMSTAAALASACCVGLALPLIQWADVIGSDIPYVAAVGICLAVFARWFAHGGFDRRRIMWLGALGAMAFSFRQEGLTALAALLAAAAWFRLSASRTRESLRSTATDLAAGAGVFVIVTAALQVLLPYELLPSYEGAGMSRIRPNLMPYLRAAGNEFGLYSSQRHRVEALDRPWLGWTLLVVGCVFLLIGVMRMLRRHDALDVVILLMAGAHAYTALTALHSNGRYFFVTVAICTVIGAQGIDALAGGLSSVGQVHKWSVVVLLALPMVWIQVPRFVTAADRAGDSRRINKPWQGPFEPSATEMLVAVYENTGPDDVVGFKKARAITLFTNRSAVQTPWPSAVPPIADWYVSEKDKNGEFPLPGDKCECSATEVWSNSKYMLYELTPDS